MSDSTSSQPSANRTVTVYYDGSCPSCVRDRSVYEKLAGEEGRQQVCWFDITGQEHELRQRGIDPDKALRELHVHDSNQGLMSELDAYIHLMSKIWLLKPIAFLIGLPVIRPWLSRTYHRMVDRRLKQIERG